MHAPLIHSIYVGLPREVGTQGAADPMERTWTTGLFKEPAAGPVYLGAENLAGDAQADLNHHGGPDKAACVYPHSHYAYWTQRLDRELSAGAFGENFSVLGQDEESVCLGDIFTLGESIVQVSQPRSPCWKIARRWRIKSLSLWVQQTGFTGWYLRVMQPGLVEAGQELQLTERPFPEWTIAYVNKLRYGQTTDPAACAALATCDTLTEGWRQRFQALSTLNADESADESARLIGNNT